MEKEQIQKLINDFASLLGGNIIMLEAFKTIIKELQNELKGESNENN